jgi:hypothetical protein
VTRILAVVIFFIFTAQVQAENCAFSAHDLSALPQTGDGPVEVDIQLYLSDLIEIHDANQSFIGDVFIRAEWQDSRLAHAGLQPCFVDQQDIWTPQLQLLNRRSLEQIKPPQFSVAPGGRVTQAVRFYGDFSFRADLSDFPFDEQELRFIIVSTYQTSDVKIGASRKSLAIGEKLSVTNWLVQLRDGAVSEHYVAPLDRYLSRFDVIFDAQRLTGFYTWQLLVPLFLVVMMTWTVFWMPLEFVAPRVGLVATSMLTLIAYRFSMASILPPIAYLTRLDLFMVASSVLVFAALASAVAVTWLEGRGNVETAIRLNTASRALAPALFLLVFIKVFVM